MDQSHYLQRKVALTGAQATGDSKGHSRQMITMAFLEEGGYFDVPIQVNMFLLSDTVPSQALVVVRTWCCIPGVVDCRWHQQGWVWV